MRRQSYLMNTKVKICGITTVEDALAAVEAGADALGFMFYEPSPRHLTIPAAAQIIGELPPFVTTVGVFVNPTGEQVRKTMAECRIGALQFHGDETPEFCRQFGLKAIKAFRVRDEASLQEMTKYRSEAWLLDSYVPGKLGGTGAQFNWQIAGKAAKLNQTIILAGGLTPHNVAQAVREVRPYGVDVSSGVESVPGKKDHGKVRAFVQAARAERVK
jgi:phosphoribosylanthranilate isomerase